MGACCGGMKTSQHKSLPENQKANNIEEKDKCANGLQDDAAVTKETPVTADQLQMSPDQEAPANHTADHPQPSTTSPEEVELKITEPDRPESQPAPAVCPVPEKLAVCPEGTERPPAPSTETTQADAGVEKTQKEHPSEGISVSEEGDVTQPKNESTARVEHMVETTEIHTTSISVEKNEDQQKVEEVISDAEHVKPDDVIVASPDAETLPTSSSSIGEQEATSVEVDHAPAAITTLTDDHQKQVDTDVVVQAADAEIVLASSDVSQQELTPPPAPADTEHVEQVPTDAMYTMASDDKPSLPSEQLVDERQDEQLPTFAAPPATDVEAATEQMSSSVNADVETPSVTTETPANADLQAEVTTVDHAEPHPAAEEVAESKDIETTNMPIIESTPSSDATASVVDGSASKLDDAASSSVAQDEVVDDMQPEELPPPLTPEKEDSPAVNEEVQQGLPSACYVEPASDKGEQPEQHAPVSDSIEEPTSKSTSEAADHASDVPVTSEP